MKSLSPRASGPSMVQRNARTTGQGTTLVIMHPKASNLILTTRPECDY